MAGTFTADDVKQKGNSLTMTLQFDAPENANSHYRSNHYVTPASTLTSPEYLINCRVVFQAKLIKCDQSILYFVKFTKKHANDELTYILRYSHKVDNIKTKGKRELCFTLESGCWQLVDDSKLKSCIWFITVTLSVSPPGNPCVSLYDDTELTDLEVRGTGGSIHLHKAVAAAFSPVIKSKCKGKQKKRVIDAPLKTTKATLLSLKQYMYEGTIPSTGVKQLLILASLYMMPDLEKRCVQQLLAEVTSEQAYYLFEFAMTHQISQLLFGIMYRVQNGILDVDQILKYKKF